MSMWRKVSGVVKDQNSIWIASLSRRTSLRNPDMEAAVIKATSHDEFSINMKNVDRVFRWLRLSSTNLKPLIWAISLRIEKTHSWVVAIKVLILMHGLYSTRLPCVQRIGRLPFDISQRKYGRHSHINAFLRAYFTFLDHKSSLLFMELQEKRLSMHTSNIEENYDLVVVQKLQSLLDLLLEVRPLSDSIVVPLVLEAMDCVVTEIFDVYSRIRNGIARILLRIYLFEKDEATMALKIMNKANIQAQELSLYFESCRDIGVRNAQVCPIVENIPDEDIRLLIKKAEKSDECIVNLEGEKESQGKLRTIITDRWETFDEENGASCSAMVKVAPKTNPIATQELPDLISFS